MIFIKSSSLRVHISFFFKKPIHPPLSQTSLFVTCDLPFDVRDTTPSSLARPHLRSPQTQDPMHSQISKPKVVLPCLSPNTSHLISLDTLSLLPLRDTSFMHPCPSHIPTLAPCISSQPISRLNILPRPRSSPTSPPSLTPSPLT